MRIRLPAHPAILLAALALPTAATAQEADPYVQPPTETAAAASGTVNLSDVLEQGGVMIYPLVGLSLIAIGLIIYYFLTVRQGTTVTGRFMHTAESLIREGDYTGLLNVCSQTDEAVASITQKTLDFATKNPTASFAEVREVTESEGTRQASLLNARISYLADVGAIAPMVGLLGTVIGMIKSFNDIANPSFAGAGQIHLAGGVSEALITTAAGLVIGIPALIFYSIFRGRVQRLIAEMEAATTQLMAMLAAQYKRAAAKKTAKPNA